jgi:adenine deaminase
MNGDTVRAALGEITADLLLRDASVFNPFLCEWEECSLGIHQGRVLGPGEYRARREVNLHGARVVPGLLDAHVHVESSLLSPFEFARLAGLHGTTTAIADPHEIANVLGAVGIEYMLACRPNLPLDLLLMLPSCVPATPADRGGAVLGAEDLREFSARDGVIGLGEVMNVPGVLARAPDLVVKMEAFRVVDGHAPGLAGPGLNAYVLSGVQSDHESSTVTEGRDRLARGMWLFVREGSTERNLSTLAPLVSPATACRSAFCTDDRHADMLCREGQIDDCVRKAIESGLEPELALRMATLSAAERFGLDDRGALAPGRRADFCVLGPGRTFEVARTFVRGIEIVDAGPAAPSVPAPRRAMNCRIPRAGDLVPAVDGTARMIEIVPGQIRTKAVDLPIRSGQLPDIEHDLLLAVVCDAYRGTGYGVGLVSGFGLRRGAIAGSVSHDAHQLVAVGAKPEAIVAALETVAECGGGLAAVGAGAVTVLPLPIAGLMSDRPFDEVVARLDALQGHGEALGAVPGALMHLSFLALTVIPERRLTERGVFDFDRFSDVPLIY